MTNNGKDLKKSICAVIKWMLVGLIAFVIAVASEHAYAYESAANYLSYYNQTRGATEYSKEQSGIGWWSSGFWDKQLKSRYGVEIYHDSSTWRYISNRGCHMLAYANAIQWLTGEKADETRMVDILYELYKVYSDPAMANTRYGDYVLSRYGGSYGIRSASTNKAWNNIVSVIDNGGCLILHVTYGGGGHYALVVGYHIKDINGVPTKLLQVVDSSVSSTVKRIPGSLAWNYTFTGTTKGDFNSNTGNYGQIWIRYDDFNSTSKDTFSYAFTSGTVKARKQINPTSLQLNASTGVLYLENTFTLNAAVYPSNANNSIIWSTSDSGVATVNNGVVSPTGIGTVTITATSSADANIKASCVLEVKYNGTGMINFNSIIMPYRYKINSNGFSWKSGSGSITSDVDLKEVFFTLVHPPVDASDPSTAQSYTWRYPADLTKTIGSKQLDMTTVNSLIKFSAISTTGQGFFEIKAVDIAGRTLTKGRIIQVSKTAGATASTDAECTNTQYRMTTRIEEPQLKDCTTLNGHKYERYLATYSWTDAKVFAERLGGHLATVNTAEENETIFSLVNKDSDFGAWIGGYRDGNTWKWVTGEPFSFTNWNTSDGEPNGQWNLENYAAMMRTAGKWRDSALNNYAWKYFVVEYEPVLASEIVLAGEKTITVGESMTIVATVLPEDTYNNMITYSSSDPSIATVDSATGLVTAISEGEVTIIATASDGSGIQASHIMSVLHKPIPVTGVTLSADEALYTDTKTITITENNSILLTANISPINADNQIVNYTSSNGDVISIEDYSNEITAVGSGTCTVTVTTMDGDFTDSITVIVIPNAGTCGDNLTWKKSGTELIISGTGAMYDYTYDTAPWGKDITSVSFSDDVTSIGHYAFYGCTELRSVSRHPSVTSIGTASFEYCSSLSRIDIGANVKMVGITAFAWCSSLTDVSIPASVEYIGEGAFCYCETLETIIIDSTNTHYYTDDSALLGKDGTLIAYLTTRPAESYRIPYGIKRIGAWCFANAKNIKTLSIPSSVVEFGHGAVESSGLTTIKCFEDSMAHTFAIENNIQYVPIDSPLINPDFVLPIGTKIIEEDAFMGISAKNIKLPEGITEIQANAFANCPNLKKIYIPEGCERIATTAFSGVSNLVIYGKTESYAEFYAERRGFVFEDVK